MASMPELGSKISLISKSDIRYEGQLYTVDPNECTIALANGKNIYIKKKIFFTLLITYIKATILQQNKRKNFIRVMKS